MDREGRQCPAEMMDMYVSELIASRLAQPDGGRVGHGSLRPLQRYVETSGG